MALPEYMNFNVPHQEVGLEKKNPTKFPQTYVRGGPRGKVLEGMLC